jgi:hypothetical protein
MNHSDHIELHPRFCLERNRTVALLVLFFSGFDIILLAVKSPRQATPFAADPIGFLGMPLAVAIALHMMSEFKCMRERVILGAVAASILVGFLARSAWLPALTPQVATNIKLPLSILAAIVCLTSVVSSLSPQNGKSPEFGKMELHDRK